MRQSARTFSTQVKLPCTVWCGPDAGHKLSGTAVKIESESMLLRLGATTGTFPRVGEKVDLQVHLPGNPELAGAKDLSIRGLIIGVTEMRDGARQFELSFRRAHFKDRNGKDNGAPPKRKSARAAGDGWEM